MRRICASVHPLRLDRCSHVALADSEQAKYGYGRGGHLPCSDASRESEVVLTFEDLLVSTDFDESLAPSLDVTVELTEKLRMSAFALLTIRASARAARP